eukprot:284197-Pelagomonas_calceolata.AAC.3
MPTSWQTDACKSLCKSQAALGQELKDLVALRGKRSRLALLLEHVHMHTFIGSRCAQPYVCRLKHVHKRALIGSSMCTCAHAFVGSSLPLT